MEYPQRNIQKYTAGNKFKNNLVFKCNYARLEVNQKYYPQTLIFFL
jgi:hypothetical protein